MYGTGLFQAVAMLNSKTGVERITTDIVSSVYPELASASVMDDFFFLLVL